MHDDASACLVDRGNQCLGVVGVYSLEIYDFTGNALLQSLQPDGLEIAHEVPIPNQSYILPLTHHLCFLQC